MVMPREVTAYATFYHSSITVLSQPRRHVKSVLSLTIPAHSSGQLPSDNAAYSRRGGPWAILDGCDGG